MKKSLLVFSWFLSSTLTVLFGLAFLALNQGQNKIASASFSVSPVLGVFSINVIPADARPRIITDFLERYDSEIKPYDKYAKLMVEAADKYNLDFRLLPAIAMQESNLCRKAPSESYNCWGHGIYGQQIVYFESYDQAIEAVAKNLSKYSKKGLLEPEDIMTRYTPQSQGSWAASVYFFMNQMK